MQSALETQLHVCEHNILYLFLIYDRDIKEITMRSSSSYNYAL
jgi:hypothetical protein